MTKLTFLRSYDEVANIRTFVFDPQGVTWLPGQYEEYVLPSAGDSEDDNRRWFTIASAPSENEIHISTRLTGSKFKEVLASLRAGDTIEVREVEGDFTWEDDSEVVLVAGGIGVTPYRSMLLERAARGQRLAATLLYFGRDDNFAFRGEFDQLAAEHPELTIKYLVGQPITADSILQNAPQAANQTTYLSGPEPMVDSVGDELQKRGVTLKQDWFPGYTDQNY